MEPGENSEPSDESEQIANRVLVALVDLNKSKAKSNLLKIEKSAGMEEIAFSELKRAIAEVVEIVKTKETGLDLSISSAVNPISLTSKFGSVSVHLTTFTGSYNSTNYNSSYLVVSYDDGQVANSKTGAIHKNFSERFRYFITDDLDICWLSDNGIQFSKWELCDRLFNWMIGSMQQATKESNDGLVNGITESMKKFSGESRI
jgi:hypothetical protein